MASLPLHPAHPERVCWGCDRFCPAHDLACGNGSVRTPHPAELMGSDWIEWARENEIDVGGQDPSLRSETELAQQTSREGTVDCQPFTKKACRDGGQSAGTATSLKLTDKDR